jgi:hypothetical protein
MIKIPINIPTYKKARERNNGKKKQSPDSWYIYKTELMLAALFYKTAGGVGRIILDYLLWQRSMNGVETTTLPNEFFLVKYKITRQRKAEALSKLKDAKLVTVVKEPGKAARVKLNLKRSKNVKQG